MGDGSGRPLIERGQGDRRAVGGAAAVVRGCRRVRVHGMEAPRHGRHQVPLGIGERAVPLALWVLPAVAQGDRYRPAAEAGGCGAVVRERLGKSLDQPAAQRRARAIELPAPYPSRS